MSGDLVSKQLFLSRLTALLGSGDLLSWPRRRLDRHILLKSVTLMAPADKSYSEAEVNRFIEEWLTLTGPSVRLDVANIRRTLVDEGYLLRDRAGRSYERPGLGPGHFEFDPEIDSFNLRSGLSTG